MLYCLCEENRELFNWVVDMCDPLWLRCFDGRGCSQDAFVHMKTSTSFLHSTTTCMVSDYPALGMALGIACSLSMEIP